jgi:hypothetical protein
MTHPSNRDDDERQHYQMHIRQDFDLIQEDDTNSNRLATISDDVDDIDGDDGGSIVVNTINKESSIRINSSHSINDDNSTTTSNNINTTTDIDINHSSNLHDHDHHHHHHHHHPKELLPIGIIGGGIGGCALALSLQRKGIPFRLFEKGSAYLQYV